MGAVGSSGPMLATLDFHGDVYIYSQVLCLLVRYIEFLKVTVVRSK